MLVILVPVLTLYSRLVFNCKTLKKSLQIVFLNDEDLESLDYS